MLRRCILPFLMLALAGSAFAAPRHEAPQPRLRNQQVTLVSDLVDQYLTINDTRFFVHDIAIARGPHDGFLFLRLDVESPTGVRSRSETSLLDAPPGMAEVFALDDVTAFAGRQLWWADEGGEVHATMLHPGDSSPVGVGGTVVVQPGTRCTQAFGGYCISPCAGGYCGLFPDCPCVDWFGQSQGHCQSWGGISCQGKCGMGNCGSEPVLGGCTCQ
jgi:hypothetical protein